LLNNRHERLHDRKKQEKQITKRKPLSITTTTTTTKVQQAKQQNFNVLKQCNHHQPVGALNKQVARQNIGVL
jgi:hypothetical protein